MQFVNWLSINIQLHNQWKSAIQPVSLIFGYTNTVQFTHLYSIFTAQLKRHLAFLVLDGLTRQVAVKQ